MYFIYLVLVAVFKIRFGVWVFLFYLLFFSSFENSIISSSFRSLRITTVYTSWSQEQKKYSAARHCWRRPISRGNWPLFVLAVYRFIYDVATAARWADCWQSVFSSEPCKLQARRPDLLKGIKSPSPSHKLKHAGVADCWPQMTVRFPSCPHIHSALGSSRRLEGSFEVVFKKWPSHFAQSFWALSVMLLFHCSVSALRVVGVDFLVVGPRLLLLQSETPNMSSPRPLVCLFVFFTWRMVS